MTCSISLLRGKVIKGDKAVWCLMIISWKVVVYMVEKWQTKDNWNLSIVASYQNNNYVDHSAIWLLRLTEIELDEKQ
jgi:hypothetical protein